MTHPNLLGPLHLKPRKPSSILGLNGSIIHDAIDRFAPVEVGLLSCRLTRCFTMKGIPLWPVGKGLGVCSKGVVKQP